MFARQTRQAEVSAAEAINLHALAAYSLCYGCLLMLALLGLLALMIALGMPVDGSTGALQVFSVLARVCSIGLLLFALYAVYCSIYSRGRVSLSAGLRLSALSIGFWCAGLDGADIGISLAQLLHWLGGACTACGVIP